MSSMNEFLIIQSKQKWYVFPLFALAILIVVITVFMFLNDGDFFLDFLSLRRLGSKLLAFVLVLIFLALKSLWNFKQVKVFIDNIEVRQLLHPSRNYVVLVKDIDSYCTEFVTDKYADEDTKEQDATPPQRIYLLTGGMLRLYVAEKDVANFAEMVDVLKNHFHIKPHPYPIQLTNLDIDKLQHGGTVSFSRVSEQTENSGSAAGEASQNATRQSSFMHRIVEPAIGGLAFIILLVFCLSQLFSYLSKKRDTSEVTYIDAHVTLPQTPYFTADSVDTADRCKCIESQMVVHGKTNDTTIVSIWAFPVRQREHLWACVKVEDKAGSNVLPIPYCVKLLHRKQTYTLKASAEDTAITVSADQPFKAGLLLCEEAERLVNTLNKTKAFRTMKDAAETGVAKAKYNLGYMYENGIGIPADTAQAHYWYAKAISQNDDVRVKVEALNQLSYFYADRERYDEAIATIDSAIAIAPKDANLYDSKGEHLYQMGRKAEAREMWQTVIAIDSDLDVRTSHLYELLQ